MEGIRQVLLSDEILSEDNIDGKKDVLTQNYQQIDQLFTCQ